MTAANGTRRWSAAAALSAAALLMTSCASPSSAETENGGDAALKITISNPANMSNVPLYLAIEKGYFEAEGLEVEPGIDLGAGSTVEAVIGGAVDMAWVNLGGALAPFSEGFDLQLVAVTDRGTPGNMQVLVKPDSPAQSLEDLQGKTLAVLSPSTTCVWLVKSKMVELGLDPDSIETTVVSPPEHPIVLDSGQVDATCTTDPTNTAMKTELGARPIFDGATEGVLSQRDYPVGGYVVSKEFAEAHADALVGFQRALAKAAAFANANHQEVRAALPTFTTVDPALTEDVTIPNYVEDNAAADFREEAQMVVDAMVATRLIETAISLDGFLFDEG